VAIALVVASLTAVPSLRAADRDKALAVIDQAIKAHGGAEALNKAQTRSRTGEGVLVLAGNLPFTTEEIVRLPDRCRTSLMAGSARRIVVINGDKGWMHSGGAAQEMKKDLFAELREEPYVWLLETLTPLRKDDFELTVLPDAKVNDRDASVVKVASKGHPDARLFFDKKTGLLIKIARRAKLAGIGCDKEYFYSDHKDYDGAKLPTKEITTINGNKESEVKFTGYKLLSKIEDKTFDKP
jgi:hypothetical protein